MRKQIIFHKILLIDWTDDAEIIATDEMKFSGRLKHDPRMLPLYESFSQSSAVGVNSTT